MRTWRKTRKGVINKYISVKSESLRLMKKIPREKLGLGRKEQERLP